MNIFFSFSGLIFCLVQCLLAQENDSRGTRTFKIASWCALYNLRADFQDVIRGILVYERQYSLDCEILLANESSQYVVISFYEWDLLENDYLVLRDSYTELSLTGKTQWYGDKTFIFRGPTKINFTTTDWYSETVITKFKLLFTVSNGVFPCEKTDFQCSNKICLNSLYVVCDGNNNCGDWSDEIDCDRKCTDDEYLCYNRRCIPMYKVCNGNNDCGDMSDENICNRDYDVYKPYRCQNGNAISNAQVCNNKNDCGDWSEEKNCHRNCNINDFPCSNGRCLEFSKVCNFQNDCVDNSDELKCHVCSSKEHTCPNGYCIPQNFVCNNHSDCGDSSDEKGCSSTENLIPVRQTGSLNLSIILSSVAIGSVLILLIILSICLCVSVSNRSNQPNNTASSSDQQTRPSSLISRMRQSFQSYRQPSAPPMEMTTSGESAPHEWQQTPSLMGRIRQSFRSRHQPTSQPPNASSPSDARSEGPVRSAIYPNLTCRSG